MIDDGASAAGIMLRSSLVKTGLSLSAIVAALMVVALVPAQSIDPASPRHGKATHFPSFTVAQAANGENKVIATSLQSDDSAYRAGIAVGDQIEAIDAHRVRSLATALDDLKQNDRATIRISVLHNGSLHEVVLAQNGKAHNGS